MQTMNTIFGDALEKYVVVYLDDIMVFSNTLEEHLKHLEEVFHRLDENELIIKEPKCKFAQKEVEFLGYLITQEGIKPTPKKIEAVRSWQPPKSVTEIGRASCRERVCQYG